jgi:hypothetical protein
MYFGEREILD